MRTLVVIGFFIFNNYTNNSYCQELTPVFENISDGLPSTEVHDMFQDSIGYMWFATDRGICRYDGDRFQIIEVESYLKTKVVFKFFKQKEDKVWIVSGKKRLYWFNPYEQKPKFIENEYNDELEAILSNSRFNRNISNIHFSKNDILISFRKAPGYLTINNETGCKLIYGQEDTHYTQLSSTNFQIENIDNKHYLQLKKKTTRSTVSSKIEFQSQNVEVDTYSNINLNLDFGISCELNTSKRKLIAISNLLICFENGKVSSSEMPSAILSLVQIEDYILVGTYNGIYKLNSSLKSIAYFLSNNSITNFYIDNENYLWISTLQNGIFLASSFNTQLMNLPEHFVTSNIAIINNLLMLHDNIKKESIFINEKLNILSRDKDVTFGQNTIRFKEKKLIKLLDLKQKYYSPGQLDAGLVYFNFFTKNKLKEKYLITGGAIWKNTKNGLIFFFRNNASTKLNFCFQYDKKKLIIGTENGLYFLDIESKKISQYPIEKSENLNFKSFINCGDRIVFGTNNGLIQFHNNHLSRIGLAHVNLNGILKIDDNNAWTFSDNLIVKITLNNKKIILTKLNLDFSLQNSVILSITEFNDKLWVATKNGLFITNIKNKPAHYSEEQVKFKLDSIRVQNKKKSVTKKTQLYKEDKIQLFFSQISFDRTKNRILEYSINGENWYETNKNSLVLGDLDFGETIIMIRHVNSPNKIICKIPIIISKHFYQTIWFKLFVFILLILIVSWGLRKVMQNLEKTKLKKLNTLSLELKLLTSKMNPHFTFNTISSIQHFILKNDKNEAIKYLSDFALLMRKSLDFSMEERIIILQEKEFIELYVQLENKRFSSNFILNFIVEPSELMLSSKIPSMLIQPMVENIILHANYQLGEEKKINISIRLKKGYFIIEVIDFGAGISKRKLLNKHKSFGLDILRSRIKLYNGKEYELDDLNISHTNSIIKKGTTVSIKLKEWIQ